MRPGAPWCTLCHADLRPPPPAPAPPPVAAPVAAGTGAPDHAHVVDPLTAPAEAFGLPSRTPAAADAEPAWPCTTCGHTNAFTADTCLGCGAGFLAAVRDNEKPLLVLPLVGDLVSMSRAQRLALAFGVVIALVLVLLGLGLLLG